MCDKVKKIPPVQIAYLAPISLGVLAPAPFFQGPTPQRGPFLLLHPQPGPSTLHPEPGGDMVLTGPCLSSVNV